MILAVIILHHYNTVKSPNGGHLWVYAKLSAIRRCLLLGGFVEIFKF